MLDFLIRDHYNLYATIVRYLEKIRALTKETAKSRSLREVCCMYYPADPRDFGKIVNVEVYSKSGMHYEYSLRHNEDYQVLYVYLGIYSDIDVGNNGYYQIEMPQGCPYSTIAGAIFNAGNIGGYYFDITHIRSENPLMYPSIEIYNSEDTPIKGKVYPLLYYIGRDFTYAYNTNESALVRDAREIRPEFETNGVEPEVIPELAELDSSYKQWENHKKAKKE